MKVERRTPMAQREMVGQSLSRKLLAELTNQTIRFRDFQRNRHAERMVKGSTSAQCGAVMERVDKRH